MVGKPIKYFSSNEAIFGSDLEKRIADIKTVGLAEAIITGQAPDGGLFMPTHFPSINEEGIKRMKNMPYGNVFVEVMSPFFEGVLARKTLEKIAKEAYTFKPFIEKIYKSDYIARLDEGPTAAFKDYAAQVLFKIVEALIREEPKKENTKSEIVFRQQLKDIKLLTYIVATSGDTGSAMGVACHNIPNMWMAILHSAFIPQHVSELQAKQMDNLEGNIYAIRVKTDFDGCAALASALQKDNNLKYMNMGSANSVNIGRLLPQIAYYFYIYSRAAEKGEEIYVSVPSGNFGNAVAGLFAKRMGLPIKLIIAVNENDVFERFYRTGKYEPAKKTHPSPSNSMNVNWPSNMRRLFQLYNGQLAEEGGTENSGRRVIKRIIQPNLEEMRKDMVAYSISDKETHKIVEDFYGEGHMIENLHSTIEPHGAVAWGAAQRFRREGRYNGKIITLETAHPGKFPESLEKISIEPELPKCLASIVNMPQGRHYLLDNDYEQVKSLLIKLYLQELARDKQTKKIDMQ